MGFGWLNEETFWPIGYHQVLVLSVNSRMSNSDVHIFNDLVSFILKGKGKGKGKGKSSSVTSSKGQESSIASFPKYQQATKLRSLDVFAGCGGKLHLKVILDHIKQMN